MIRSFSISKISSTINKKRRYSTNNTKHELYFFGLNDKYQFFKDQKKIFIPNKINVEGQVKYLSCGWAHILVVNG